MAAEPSVAVVIPTHRRRDSLRKTLGSLASQTAGPSSYEVVVAVDGLRDPAVAMLDTLETPYRLRWVEGEQRGRAGACNAAIATATAEVLIVLDDDMVAAPQLVERHRSHHPHGSRNCVLGAVPVSLGASSPRAASHVKGRFDAHLSRLADPEHLNRPRSFYTGNASLRADLMAEVGGFDEDFAVYGNEDVDLALRLRAVGAALVYDPEALAHQSYEKDLAGLQADTFQKGRTTVVLARRHPEVFADLRLSEPASSKRPWLVGRAALLAATRTAGRTRRAVFAIASLLERGGLWRSPLFYRAVLDYAFWAGVEEELEANTDGGALSKLGEELARGPIDFLLHG